MDLVKNSQSLPNERYLSPQKKAGDTDKLEITPKGLSGLKRLPSLSPSDDQDSYLDDRSASVKKTDADDAEEMSLCQQLLKDYGIEGMYVNYDAKKHSGAVKQGSKRVKGQSDSDDSIPELIELLRISNET